jgi:hypothetical protein
LYRGDFFVITEKSGGFRLLYSGLQMIGHGSPTLERVIFYILLPVSMFISSKNTPTDIPRGMLDQIFGDPSEVDM